MAVKSNGKVRRTRCPHCGGSNLELAPKGYLADGERRFRTVCRDCDPKPKPTTRRGPPLLGADGAWLQRFEAALGRSIC